MMSVLYSVVVPVFNEEEVIAETYRRLTAVMSALDEEYELVFVNDGSKDRTSVILKQLAERDQHVVVVDFARNFGHQIAITAGMDQSRGDAVIVIDADLQDPPELIPQMIDLWKEGYEVVYGRRSRREGESAFKLWTAAAFYRILRAATEVEIPVDTGDFRLIDRAVCDTLKGMRERNRFVRGLVSWVGFRQTALLYFREERFAGETKYPLKKMISLAADGLTSFSYKPLKLPGYLGALVCLASVVWLIAALVSGAGHRDLYGWEPGMAGIAFLNGAVLVFMGVMGEYVGRILDESRNRPLYILRESSKGGECDA